MSAADRYSIIIAGGGPAGLGTALHLAQDAPHLADRTLILEAQSYPRPKLCGGGITFHGEEQLEQLGITIDVPAVHVNRLIFRLGKQQFVVPFRRAMRIIQRANFDSALADAVQAKGLAIHTGERVLDLQPVEGGMLVITDRDTYRARVVIAADGANSTVRRKLGIYGTEGVARLLRVISSVDSEVHPAWQSQTALFDFSCVQHGIQGYAWDFPAYMDGKATMNRGIFDSRIAPDHRQTQPHGNLKTTFSDWLGERDETLTQDNLRGHPVRWFRPEAEFSRPHVLLAGDAAGVDALFAEGISYAMEYGEIITRVLIDAFAKDDFSFVDYRQRLLSHRLGSLLLRRAWMAETLYRYQLPAFWWVFWQFASIAPHAMQRSIGAWMALLPEKGRSVIGNGRH